MLKEAAQKYFRCPACGGKGLDLTVFEEKEDSVINGVLSCPECRTWYRIEEELAELLVPDLRNAQQQKQFIDRFSDQWNGWNDLPAGDSDEGREHKLEQKSFYDDDAVPYETSMLKLPFWMAVDSSSIDKILTLSSRKKTLLEIGCGTGRISFPTSGTFETVLAFDISESMVKTAMRKRKDLGRDGRTILYFVGDAENAPIQNDCADVALLYGILHHVENPAAVLKAAARCLCPGGAVFGCENNRSVFRPFFDLLMRVRKLWNEKAHEDHFIMSHQMMRELLSNASLDGAVWTSVFLPPHLFNILSPGGAKRLLRFTDTLCGLMPWGRWQGGLLMFAGNKKL